MDAEQRKATSKHLSYVLRHRPDAVGITLDAAGWVPVDVLLAALAKHGHRVTREQLNEVIATNEKQRFALSDDGQRIRASQGHSVEVELGNAPAEPPQVLYHGTVQEFLPSIAREGLLRRRRHHVHLSETEATANQVGSRRGRPVLLAVDAQAMRQDGHAFYVTPNRVWLTDAVPPQYLSWPGKPENDQ